MLEVDEGKRVCSVRKTVCVEDVREDKGRGKSLGNRHDLYPTACPLNLARK